MSGILHPKHAEAFNGFLKAFEECGYDIFWQLVDANDYNVPENRKRIIIVGYRKDLHKKFVFPEPKQYKPTLRDAIGDLPEPIPAKGKNKTNGELQIPNHEYMIGVCGTLNQQSQTSRPKISIPKINHPTRIIELAYKPGSKTTIELTMDNGWAISFRIHNASTIVEPSLKFDIQLIDQPAVLFYIDVDW